MATLMFSSIHKKLWAERRRLISFFIIGISSLLLNLGSYALLSRVLWPDGPRTFEYTIVVVVVTVFNFEANRHFTFEAAQRTWGAVSRFTLVALVATALNSFLFWIGQDVLKLYDFLVIILVTAIIAFFTFASHRFFTFHPDPWRHLRKKSS